jgi:hypothetical protein
MDDISNRVQKIVNSYCSFHECDSPLVELGPIYRVAMLADIEDEFDTLMPDDIVEGPVSISDLIEAVEKYLWENV